MKTNKHCRLSDKATQFRDDRSDIVRPIYKLSAYFKYRRIKSKHMLASLKEDKNIDKNAYSYYLMIFYITSDEKLQTNKVSPK